MLVAVALPVPATATTGIDATTGETTLGVAAADVEQYVQMFAVGASEAAWRLSLQPTIGRYSEALNGSMPATFGGLWIQNEPTYRVVVQTTDLSDEAEVIQLAKAYGVANLVDFRTARFSLGELSRDEEQIADAFWPTPVDLSIDVLTDSVDVRVVSLMSVPVERLPPSARITTVPSLGHPTTDIYGGLPLGSAGCTSGFGISHGTTRGIVTAGHCGNTATYGGVSLPFQSERFSGSHDEQWHTAPGFTVRNLILDREPDPTRHTRAISSRTFRSSQPIGGLVCKYGSTTHYTCGTLITNTFWPAYVPSANGTFMLVHRAGVDEASGGDSGGPVFLSYSAYGIVSGEAYTLDGLCNCDLIYVAPEYVESGLGVTILTS
jgi:hypothetical protein